MTAQELRAVLHAFLLAAQPRERWEARRSSENSEHYIDPKQRRNHNLSLVTVPG
jgi:hypothetical protein